MPSLRSTTENDDLDRDGDATKSIRWLYSTPTEGGAVSGVSWKERLLLLNLRGEYLTAIARVNRTPGSHHSVLPLPARDTARV